MTNNKQESSTTKKNASIQQNASAQQRAASNASKKSGAMISITTKSRSKDLASHVEKKRKNKHFQALF